MHLFGTAFDQWLRSVVPKNVSNPQFMAHDSCRSLKITIFNFEKFQNSEKSYLTAPYTCFLVHSIRVGPSTMVNEQRLSNIWPETCQKWSKKNEWDRVPPGANRQSWSSSQQISFWAVPRRVQLRHRKLSERLKSFILTAANETSLLCWRYQNDHPSRWAFIFHFVYRLSSHMIPE